MSNIRKTLLRAFSLLLVMTATFHLQVASSLWGAETILPPSSSNPPPAGGSPATDDTGGTGTQQQQGDSLQPAGMSLGYGKDGISFSPLLIPAAIESGSSGRDEAGYLTWFSYELQSLGEGSRIGFPFLFSDLPSGKDNIFTIGTGGSLGGLLEGLELSPETYFQFGEQAAAVDQRAWAQQLGGKYVLPNNENHIGFGLNFRYVSGDDGAGGSDNRSFLSYENVEPLLILENQTFGLDQDPNYWAIRGSIGAALSVGSGGNNLILPLNLGYHQLIDGVSPAGPSEVPSPQPGSGPVPGITSENPFEVFDQLGGVAPPSFSGTPQTPESRSIGEDQAPPTESPSPAASPSHDAAPSATC